MKTKNYTVVESQVSKITVTITRYQMWKNFVDAWADVAWDEYTGIGGIKQVAEVLLNGESISKITFNVQQLFKDGWTCLLMGDAMNVLDVADKDILREIVVVDTNSITGEIEDKCVITHGNIVF